MQNQNLDFATAPQQPRFNLRSLLQSTVLPVVITLILFVGSTFFLAIPTIKDKLIESRKEMIRELTNAVWSLLNSYEQKVQAGELTLEEAQLKAISHIRAIQFGPGQKDYFWINDFQHKMIMHPYRKDLEGQGLYEYKDQNGVHLFREIVSTVLKSGQGYVSYQWQWQDNIDQIRQKLSFVKGFNPWGWIIGTGFYPDDVNQQIEDVLSTLRVVLLGSLLVIIALSTYMIKQARKLEVDRVLSTRFWKDSEARYKRLVESMNEGMAIQREDDTFSYVNNSMCKILGYEREELQGKNIYDFLDEENSAIMEKETLKRREKGESSRYELTAKVKDGKIVHLLVSGHPYYDSYNRFSGTYALIIDITEEKRKDLALKENEEKYHSILESMKDGFCEVDLGGRFLFSNQAFQNVLGYSNEELRHLDYREYLSAENVKRIGDVFKGIYQTGESMEATEVDYRRKDGSTGYMEFSGALVKNTEGEPTGFSCILRDVTARKKAQQEMENMRLYLKNTIDLMPSVMIVMNRELRITQWNLEAEKVTGIAYQKAEGKFFSEVLSNFHQYQQHIETVIESQQPISLEKINISMHGEPKIYDIIIYPIHSAAFEGAVLRVDDITARIRMEELMIQSEKMMSVGELAAGTAHEINNPLGGILHAAQMIELRLTPEREQNVRIAEKFDLKLDNLQNYLKKQKILHYLEGIRKSGNRAADIVTRMLHFSRASQSEMTMVNLPELLERTLALAGSDYDLKKKYDFRRIRINRFFDPHLPNLPCVVMEIEQVLLNIFKNAAQAMTDKILSQDDPTLTIRLQKISDHMEIRISDNGVGMEDKVRKKVFEPFFTTKPIGEGTGLGLSVAYMIVTNNHKGTIEVTSVPGDGSTFIIMLPLKQKSLSASA
ncbi:MAG: PAS domain S-box protein [Proteobacteria bacterium]|nr:PAS domain S-box protein [Pseudomonadota bacterium]